MTTPPDISEHPSYREKADSTASLPTAAEYAANARAFGDALAGRVMAAHPAAPRPASPWIMTASGRAVAYLDPDPDTIALSDIGAQLGKICRYNGATGPFYTVAQHSVFVADILPMDSGDGHPAMLLKTAGLFHDAHETITGDIVSPMKQAIVAAGGGDDVIKRIETGLDRAIYTAFGLPWPLPAEWVRQIKLADMIALATERRDLMPPAAQGHPEWEIDLPAPSPLRIKPLPWDRAEDLFLTRARELAAIAWLSGGAWDR